MAMPRPAKAKPASLIATPAMRSINRLFLGSHQSGNRDPLVDLIGTLAYSYNGRRLSVRLVNRRTLECL